MLPRATPSASATRSWRLYCRRRRGYRAVRRAQSSLPSHLIVLVPDARAWRTEPPVPAGTPLVLPPSLASLGPAGRALGLVPFLLRDPVGGRRDRPASGAASGAGGRPLHLRLHRPPEAGVPADSQADHLGHGPRRRPRSRPRRRDPHRRPARPPARVSTTSSPRFSSTGRWGSSIRSTTGRCSRRSGRPRSNVGVPRPTSPISWAAALSAVRRSPRGSAFCRARSPGSCTTPSSLASACRCGRRTRAPRPAS